ncbi:MAG: FHA domain-containing protein [Planctomycetota bacterium]|jgi:hypothetical protein|nr:FHA domain-containing protein [Planctomycetota bacterium]
MNEARLIVAIGDQDQFFDIPDGRPIFAGRTEECDIRLASPAVSRLHAVFINRNGEFGMKDMNSSNGTYLNGKRVTSATRLYDGDVIRIADFTLTFARREAVAPVPDRAGARNRHTAVFRNLDLDSAPAENRPPPAPEAPPLPAETPTDIVGKSRPAPASEPEGKPPGIAGETPPPAPPLPLAPPDPIPGLPQIADFTNDRADGENDASFQIEEAAAADSGDAALAAITKAAAEAGLTGEFVPETEEPPPDREEKTEGAAPAPAPAAAEPPAGDRAGTLPLDPDIRRAIEARLQLYAFLENMRRERAAILARNPNLPDPVKSELARQDREVDKPPAPDQADGMVEKRLAKRKDLLNRIAEAKKKGETPPAKPSRNMRNAEEMAIAQWRFCSQSGRRDLPAARQACLRLARDEPLARYFSEIGQDPAILLGGGIYYLALETLLEEAKNERQRLREKLARLPDPANPRKKRPRPEEEEEEETPTESREELLREEEAQAARAAWIGQEAAFMEKALIQEFWRLYGEFALAFIPRGEEMPPPVRAFLRHGAVGFKPWWMKGEVRDHLVRDCAQDVSPRLTIGRSITNVVYADEYLAAVANLECTPALDENLEINERNSPNWKADKALRKLINARSQSALMAELVGSLNERAEKLNAEGAEIDDKIAKLLPGAKNYKKIKNELGMQRQSLKVEATKLSNLSAKITNETLAGFEEVGKETEERFASGEIPRPSPEFLIRRECEAIHKIGRLLANLKERFMPLVLRDNFTVDTDAVNDRPAILAEIEEMERRDPAVFLENLVASKKKAARVDLRVSPIVVLIPSAGILAYSWNPRAKPENGRLALPTCFIRRRIRERQITYLLADFRWDTSKAAAGMDVMTSETIVAAFMTVRWDWRKKSKEGREKGLIYSEQNDRTNWRRVYEAYLQTAYDAGKKLFNRNYDFYERIIGKYFDLPEGVTLLRK